MLVKCHTQYASKFGKLSSGHRTRKVQFSFQSQRKAMPKNDQTSLISIKLHASKVILKILQARLQQYMYWEFPDVQAGFKKGRATRDQIANILWIIEKARGFQTKISFCFIDYAKDFMWITTKWGKSLKRWVYQTTWPASCETCMQGKKQQLELDVEQWTGFQIGKGVSQGYILSLAYLTYMQSTSWEILGWIKHKLESRLPGEISITLNMQMTPPLRQKARRN